LSALSNQHETKFDHVPSQLQSEGQTKVINGQKEVELLAYAYLERASKTFLKAITDDRFPKNTEQATLFIQGLFAANPSFKFQLIADIQKTNLHYYELLQRAGVELRHIESNRVSFAVSKDEYIATPLGAMEELIASGADIPTEVVWSTRKDLIFQAQQIFETMWKSAVPAEVRIREIEQGSSHVETRVFRDAQEILEETRRMANTSTKYSISSVSGGLLYGYNYLLSDYKDILGRQKQGQHKGIRWLTTIDDSCVEVAKKLLEIGMEIRHVSTVPSESFGFSEKEVGVTVSRLEGGRLNTSALFSNDPMYIEHYSSIFDQLWENGLDATARIKEIEQGIDEPEIKIIRNKKEIQTLFLDIVNNAKSEIMLLLPTMNACFREEQIGMADAIYIASSQRGVKVRMLAPRALHLSASNKDELSQGPLFESKLIPETISPDTVTVLIADKTHSLILELDDDSALDFKQAIGLATYSTRGSTVKANSRFFERIWEAVEEKEREKLLLESERRSRKEAELLRDILTHDIRNFNQASRIGTEFIAEQVKGRSDLESVANTVIQAIDGSTHLVEKAKKLGMILSTGKHALRPINLIDAIDRSLLIVKAGNPTKLIKETRKIISSDGTAPAEVQVLADDFLEEIFTNLFSNSARFTQGTSVPLDILIEEKKDDDGGSNQKFWQITIGDYGPGISSNDLDSIFQRYSKGQKGSGLGLSIVQTLVSMYGGRVTAHNRNTNGSTGAIFEVSLRKAGGRDTA
jgi:signal transduction histidine kinase